MCGFVGLIGPKPAAPALFLGLQAIQHRGQDAAGISTWGESRQLRLYKDVGRVIDVFDDATLKGLKGSAGIAQVRYPTVGASTRTDAQPFITRRPPIALAHNGNVTNMEELGRHLASRGMATESGCDAEPILMVLADELSAIKPRDYTIADISAAVKATMRRVRGSYAVIALLEVDEEVTLVAFRDPHGIRPAVYGTRDDGAWSVASESVSLDVNEFKVVGDVPPGGMVILRNGQTPIVRQISPRPRRHCIFEDIYFARPDSVMEGHRVNTRRWELGIKLAEEWAERNIEADVVVAVPDTARPAAQAMAEKLGLPYREGFIKNRYSGRTFIMPDQATREAALRLKINVIDEIFRGRRVLIVDDSIVRGTTMRWIMHKLREHDPSELHLAIFSPAVRHPCYYGIDMPSPNELVAHGRSQERLEPHLVESFGVDSVTFLSDEGLQEVAGSEICSACFTGEYPVAVDEQQRVSIVRERRPTVVPAVAP